MNLVFLSILSRKVFAGPDFMGFVWAEWERRSIQFMQFAAIFVMSVFLAALVTL